jgi:hypothetical protein
VEGSGRSLIEEISRHLPRGGGGAGSCGKTQSEELLPLPKFEGGTC